MQAALSGNNRTLAGVITLLGTLLLGLVAATVQAAAWQAGEHYEVLQVPVKTADPDRVEVVEVFSYACIHCYNFDPVIEAWVARQDDGVVFRRVPAIFSPVWAHFAQAYFTAQVLEVEDQVHTPLFRAIHQQGADLSDEASLAALFQEVAGVDPDEFKSVFESFAVRGRVQQAEARTRAYRITGVPTVIVNGKYRTDGGMAGGNTEMLELVDYLVERERSAPASAAGG